MEIEQIQSYIDRETGKRDVLNETITAEESRVKVLSDRTGSILQAQALIQKVAMSTQQLVIVRINDIVNKVIQTCAPEYTFKMDFAIKRSKSECELQFYNDGHRTNLLDGDSGGILNVACIALRIAVWTLSTADDCLILDEALANLSLDLQPLMGEVLHELSKELGLQIIMVSHSPSIDVWADNVYIITKQKGISNLVT